MHLGLFAKYTPSWSVSVNAVDKSGRPGNCPVDSQIGVDNISNEVGSEGSSWRPAAHSIYFLINQILVRFRISCCRNRICHHLSPECDKSGLAKGAVWPVIAKIALATEREMRGTSRE